MKVKPGGESAAVIEKINDLLDPGSFMEMGEHVTARYTEFYHPESVQESDGVVTGYGTVGGRLVFIFAQNSEVMGGTFGEQHGRKIIDIYEHALKAKAPVIGLLDCAGFRIEEGLDGINPLDCSFELARKAGVTAAVVSPGSANAVAGQIYAVKTAGKRIDKMSMGQVGIKFSLGENPKMTYNDRDETPVTRMAIAAVIREALFKARRYGQDIEKARDEDGDMPEYDIKCEALLPLLDGKIKAHFHCHRADDIFTAIRIASEFSLDYTLVHCTDGYLIADELAQEKASAVIGPVICDRCKPEMASLSPENAAVLAKNGVKVAVCTDHSEVPIEYLPLSVGICMKNGLPFNDALLSVTRNAAEIAGIAERVGSVEVGKDADLVMFSSEPFEVMSSPDMVMINGEIIGV